VSDDRVVQDLVDIEAIKQLKARYFRTLDTNDWAGFANVFAEDAAIDVTDDAGPEAGHVSGRSAIAARIEKAVGSARTVHHGHMPELKIEAPDRASGIWAMYDYVEFSSSTPEKRVGLHGFGHYHETYIKSEGQWRIKTMKLTRLRIDPLS
jgi:uncharacterized protein (TIGR02246 family)